MAGAITNILESLVKSKLTGQTRFYPRWSHRRPAKVYTAEEYEALENQESKKEPDTVSVFEKYGGLKPSWERQGKDGDKTVEPVKFQIKPKKIAKPLVASYQKSKVKTDMFQTVISSDNNFLYTKMDNNDRRVAKILTEIKSKKEKEKKELILLEGKRLIKEALQSGCHLKYILFSRKEEVEYLKPYLPKVGAELYKMPYKEMQMWSDLTTNPGVMGIFKTPALEDFLPKHPLPFSVICDNVREPGNLGAILRICAAVGCENVILTKGCVSLWDTKVLRSSAGAHFKLRIQSSLEWESIEGKFDDDATFFIADNRLVSNLDEDTSDLLDVFEKIPIIPYYSVNFKSIKHIVLIVGGETLGVSKSSYEIALKKCGTRLNIPLSNDIESLNVGAALGIIAFEVRKQLACVNK